ncbi:hypothetical protein ACB092_06G252600 [Castanea dentata]
MASYSQTKAVLQQRKPFPNDGIGRPRMLKDFLNDTSNSCTSTGFKSLPRQPCNPNAQVFTNNTNSKLLRSSSKAASTTISALQAMINAVKNFPLKKSQSILPRSLSRRLARKKPSEVKITIRVKDIIRWTSFRDLVEEKSQPLDFNSSPSHCTTTTITTGSTNTTCSSNNSSWCESDFTSEYLPSWGGGNSQDNVVNEVDVGKKYLPLVGEDCLKTTTGTETYADVGPNGELWCDEKEQQSPVSVLNFQVGEGEESFSSFTRSLANMERTRQNLLQKIQLFESLAKLEPFNQEECMSMEENTKFDEEEPDEFEKKVSELFVKTRSTVDIGNAGVELLLLDFFRDELTTKRCQTKMDDDEFDSEVVSTAKAWVRGEHNGLHEWGIEHKREAYISDMYRRERWSNFEGEQEELAFEFESGILGDLLDEVLVDLFLH